MMIGITGAGGFIGSFLTKYFLENTNFKLLINLRNSNPSFDLTNKRVKVIKGDISNSQVCQELSAAKVIIHLGQSLKPNSSINFKEIIKNDITPTFTLLEHIKDKPIHFIFISSGGTVYKYIPGQSIPFKETDPAFALSYYGTNKIFIENYLYLLSGESKFSVTVLRISNPYGALTDTQRMQGFIGRSVNLIQNKKPLEIFGNLNVVRDYIHLNDISEGIIKVINRGTISKFDIFNLGSGKGYSLKDVINIYEELTDKKIEIHYNSQQVALPYNVLNIEKFKKFFNWEPKISLRDGIKTMF